MVPNDANHAGCRSLPLRQRICGGFRRSCAPKALILRLIGIEFTNESVKRTKVVVAVLTLSRRPQPCPSVPQCSGLSGYTIINTERNYTPLYRLPLYSPHISSIVRSIGLPLKKELASLHLRIAFARTRYLRSTTTALIFKILVIHEGGMSDARSRFKSFAGFNDPVEHTNTYRHCW
jgi:hypothetical protein